MISRVGLMFRDPAPSCDLFHQLWNPCAEAQIKLSLNPHSKLHGKVRALQEPAVFSSCDLEVAGVTSLHVW